MLEKINTIVEGAMPDTPSRLMYCSLELEIPENINLATYKSDERFKWLLYGRFNPNLQIVNNPDFESFGRKDAYDEIKRRFKGGFPIDTLESGLRWAFDAQRSFTTRDGRIYVEVTYFHPDWRWYLDCAPVIVDDAKKIFSGETSDGILNEHPKRAF